MDVRNLSTKKTIYFQFGVMLAFFILLSTALYRQNQNNMSESIQKYQNISLAKEYYREPLQVIHRLCPTADKTDVIKLSLRQGSSNATALVLAGSSKTLPHNTSFIHEIDFLMMWELDSRSTASKRLFTHCFIDWPLQTEIQCEVVGFGIVQGQLILSFHETHTREGHLVCSVHSMRIPSNIELNVRLIDSNNRMNGLVKLCRLNSKRKIYRLIGCSQPLFQVHKLEEKWPGLIRMWVKYYTDYLGFGLISIYDIDGTAEPYLDGLLGRGIIKYYKSWAPTASMHNLSLNGFTYCAETMMENQCIWQSRGFSEWAMLIHGPDNFLNDNFGAPNLLKYLDQVKNRSIAILLTTVVFGAMNMTISKQKHAIDLFEIVKLRECNPIISGRHLPIVDPRKAIILFVHAVSKPFNHVATSKNECPVLVNHYVTMFDQRSIHPPDQVVSYCHDASLYDKTLPYHHLFR